MKFWKVSGSKGQESVHNGKMLIGRQEANEILRPFYILPWDGCERCEKP
jgi:hypothetical protein